MNRLSFVTNKKLKRLYSVISTLTIGSVWKNVDSHLHARIKSYKGIERGKYVYDVETCVYPRWFKRNQWDSIEWRVDEVYIRHDFVKQYQKVKFFEVANVEHGFKFKYIPRYIAMTAFIAGCLSLYGYFTHPTELTFFKVLGWICIPINLFFYVRASRLESELDGLLR